MAIRDLHWVLYEPGVIGILHTGVTIVHDPERFQYHLEWNGKVVAGRTGYMTLEYSKSEAASFLNEMLLMGYEP